VTIDKRELTQVFERARARPATVAATAWLVAFVAISAFLNLFGASWIDLSDLAIYGHRTAAAITRVELNNHDTCLYVYRVAGRRYHGQDSCPPAGHVAVGSTLTATYDPANPSLSASQSPGSELRSDVVITLLLSTFVAFACVKTDVGRRRRPANAEPDNA
jgi:hypothetical protein